MVIRPGSRLLATMLPSIFLASLAGGCGWAMYQGYNLERSAPAVPKQGRCEFQVVSSLPHESVQEIGTLSLKNGINGDVPRDASRFRADVHDQVCELGGDVVLTEVNGHGDIVRGIVFRRQ
jgi:hypothetical protein